MSTETIRTLVKKAKNNDLVAQKALIERFRPLIFKVARKYTYNQFELEDAYQDGYLLLLKAIKEFDFSRDIPFPGFFSCKLRYFYIDRLRHQKYLNSSSFKEFGSLSNGYSEDPETLYLKSEKARQQRQQFHAAYLKLTPLQKRVILKRFAEEKSFKQISEELGNSAVSCRNICQQALKKLKRECQCC